MRNPDEIYDLEKSIEQDPRKIMKIHIESETVVNDTTKNDKAIQLTYKRGYNSLMDFNTGRMYDPRNL